MTRKFKTETRGGKTVVAVYSGNNLTPSAIYDTPEGPVQKMVTLMKNLDHRAVIINNIEVVVDMEDIEVDEEEQP